MGRSFRICLITATYWPAWGGAEGQCRLLARELRCRGHEVVVLTRGRPDAPATDLLDGVPVRRTTAFGPGYWRSVTWTLTAALWLRRHGRGFHILQCYQLLSPAHVGILGCQPSGGQAVVVRPACSGPYGDVAEVRRLPLTWARKHMLQRANAFVTLSEAIEAELAGFGLGSIPFHRIPNAVDLQTFRPATGEERRLLRATQGLPQERVLCTFMGRLVPQKNPDLLLEAWSKGGYQGGHLVLVGDGPMRARLEADIGVKGYGGQISLAGPTSEPARYLRASDLLVLPSRAEGMSNVILEAMACGLPVVATDLPGNREVLGGDGRAGLLVPPANPSALAEAVGGLVASPKLRGEMGDAARAIVEQQFDMQKIILQYLSLYAEIVSQPGSGWRWR